MKSVEAQSTCMYEIVGEISTSWCLGDNAPIYAAAISDHGVVVGHYVDCAFNDNPFTWSEETGFVEIPLPKGVSSARPEDINNNGEIAGSLFRPGVGGRAFRYKDGVWTELPPTNGGLSSRASGINDDGWVTGDRSTGPDLEDRSAFRWRDDIVEEFQPRNGDSVHAHDVNKNVSVVGQTSGQLQGSQRAFWWVGQTVVVIPPLPGGETSDADVINDNEMVAGTSGHQAVNQLRSWHFLNGEQVDLGLLSDASRTRVVDINNARQIVGRSVGKANGTDQAFLWQHGEIVSLTTLVIDPPEFFRLAVAFAINNEGVIVAEDPFFAPKLYVLAPVDRPLGDVNIDCVVDVRDLIAVLEEWGPDKTGHPTDIVTSATFQPPGDGQVDGADLAVVLGNWSVSSSQSSPKRSK